MFRPDGVSISVSFTFCIKCLGNEVCDKNKVSEVQNKHTHTHTRYRWEGGWHQLADMFHSACRHVFVACGGVLAMHQLAPLQNLSEMSLESVTFQTTTSMLKHNTLASLYCICTFFPLFSGTINLLRVLFVSYSCRTENFFTDSDVRSLQRKFSAVSVLNFHYIS